MIFFTICSRNFIGYSGALWSSLRKVYPQLEFYLVLCDDENNFDSAALPYPIIKMGDLGISNLNEMKERYNITELNTSLKPFAFQYIFELHPGEPVVYLDPDIFVVSRLEELETYFASGVDCVLTPHICEPAEYAEMSDLKFLIYGIYNFGFCALRDTPETKRLVAWWGRRLEEYCTIDSARGLFVDQKWGDYFPAFIQNTRILRHPGYNVAYWNLSQRRLAIKQGEWTVNGLPLRFIHFSGNRIEDENVFTRHAGQFNVHNTPSLVQLLDAYRKSILSNGHAYYSVIPYAFNWSGADGFNEHTPEELRRTAMNGSARHPHLQCVRYDSMEQFCADRNFIARTIAERRKIELADIGADEAFELDGYCTVCRDDRKFITSFMYASARASDGRLMPNWREHLSCMTCGSTNRVRATLNIVDQIFPDSGDARVYITEQVTPLFNILKTRRSDIIGSEYLSWDTRSGDIVDGLRHEDIQQLSFPSDSFDLILSLDVLEHVPFPEQAFAELFRCLRPDGRLIFTVPFDYTRGDDKIRARMTGEGEIEHLLPPEYHGNPLDMEKGALCFRYFSWGVLDKLKEAGFEEAAVFSYWSEELKHYGDPQFVIFARKATSRLLG